MGSSVHDWGFSTVHIHFCLFEPELNITLTMHEEDRLVSVLPIRYSNSLVPNIHIHQFPLLTRPLQVPPSAAASGKRIRARLKSGVRRLEVHVPVDTRPEVWNGERSHELGKAREEDDKEKNQELPNVKQREGEEPRLQEVRMRSEQLSQMGSYVLGIVRDGNFQTYLLRTRLMDGIP